MPSESNSIINTLFGCCLGRRGHSSTIGRGNLNSEGNNVGDNERTPLIGGHGKQVRGGQNNQGTTSTGHIENNLGKEEQSAVSRKKVVNVAKLRAIRDQANDAFFYVDNSQLLPSSTSFRPLNMTTSQMMGVVGTSKRDQKRQGTTHQDLVAESDKAERLYRAAITSSAGGLIDDSNSVDEREAPMSLVRQMNVSIREAVRRVEQQKKESSFISNLSRKPSSSPQDAHHSMGLDVSEGSNMGEDITSNHLPISKLPSMHSLRTLRLSSQSNLDLSLTESEADSALGRQFDGDDEEWNRRGRTRSKRGLTWIDSGPSKAEGRAILDQIFSDGVDASGSTAKVNDEEEVPNALRLTSKQTETMKAVQGRLMATSSIAEVWNEDTQDT